MSQPGTVPPPVLPGSLIAPVTTFMYSPFVVTGIGMFTTPL